MTRSKKAGAVLSLAAALAALLMVILPGTAAASFDRHFTVLTHYVASRETPNGFTFGAVLHNPVNPANRVGSAHARCRVDQGRKPRCRILFHFDGSIGGFGDLLVKGNFSHGDQTLTVVDGDGDFGGRIAGKVVARTVRENLDRMHFDLTR
jgi:hypothetical protein